jgi:hypothetical protein
MSETVDFETDFSEMFDPPLERVDVVRDISRDEFEHRYRRRDVPVIIEGVASSWPAIERWLDPGHLAERAGNRTVYPRDLAQGSIDLDNYRETYRKMRFGDFVDAIFQPEPPAWYLTQGSLMQATGANAGLQREIFPAYLPELADDIVPPPYWDRRCLFETNLWMGAGLQSSALHFDEFDNINAVVSGSKRWLLFPAAETAKLLRTGGSGRNSVTRGFHAAEGRRFDHPGRRQARGYQCLTKAGQLLFVPAGMWHQVFSGPGLTMAVNFWYVNLPSDLLRCCRLHARRYAGFRSRKRYALALGGVCAQVSWNLTKHALGLSRTGKVRVGPTSYS